MTKKTNPSLEIYQVLNLPRPLVNKILAHAQKSTDSQSTCVGCGLISADTNDNKFYYPFTELTNTSNCFNQTNTSLNKILKRITDKQQTIFAYVFTAPNNTKMPDKNIFSIDKHYYIMNSLDTKGVLSMQGFYREGNDLQEVELTLEP